MSDLSVAHVTNVIGGGMGTVFRVLLPAQVRRGDRVTLYARHFSPDDVEHFTDAGVRLGEIGGLAGLARALRTHDIVHLHSADLGLLVAGRLSRRPTVFTLHGLRAQTRAASTVSLRRLPTVAGVRRRAKRAALAFLMRHAMTRITTVSQFLAGKTATSYGVPADKVVVVYNGIALDDFSRSRREHTGSGSVVGWVGRMVPVKRVEVLLRAAAAAVDQGAPADMRVVLVGDGDERDSLERLAGSLGIRERVEFAGHLEAPQAALVQMDLFVFPSRDEGGPLAVNEAMAVGLPALVMRDGGGAAELVQRSGGGLAVPDEEALARAIVDLLGDAEARGRLAERAVAYADRELHPASWADRFDKVYRVAMASKRAR